MIRHLLKVVWSMRRTNFLIILEIFISFLVVFAVATGAIYSISNYRNPVGFSIENVWNISIDMQVEGDDTWDQDQVDNVARALEEVERLEEVEASALIQYPPYSGGTTSWQTSLNGRDVRTYRNEVTDGALEVLDLDLIEGRWFEPTDDALAWNPVVIDIDSAKAFFGDEPAVGKSISEPDSPREYRVVGIVSEFRKNGEFESQNNYVFQRQRQHNVEDRPPRNITIRVRPGTTAEFETALQRRLQDVVPTWSFEVRRLRENRELALQLQMIPLTIGGVIASFLILMVVLGLTGVMWQNVTRRTREIGLRRAMGATGTAVYRQILLEIALISSVGLLVGVAVVLQIPLLGWFAFIPRSDFVAGLVVALATIYALTSICGLYPSWLASRVQPTEALHYE